MISNSSNAILPSPVTARANPNAPWSNSYGATATGSSIRRSTTTQACVSEGCMMLTFTLAGAASILGLGVAQLVTKLATGEKSEALGKATGYTTIGYLVVVLGYCLYKIDSSPSGGYRSGSSSSNNADTSSYYWTSGDYSYHGGDSGGHHSGGFDSGC